jgi:hypothetical protein
MLAQEAAPAGVDVWLTRGASVATILAAVIAILAILYARNQWKDGRAARGAALDKSASSAEIGCCAAVLGM